MALAIRVFEHTENGIASELTVYVAIDAPVKFAVLKLRNISGRARRLSVTGYWEWVLGELRQKILLHVQTEVDLKTGALLARNPYNTEFADRIAFIDVSEPARTLTGDRKEFLGRNGSLSNPAALSRRGFPAKSGAGLDPCAAVQVTFDLPPARSVKSASVSVSGAMTAEVRILIRRFRGDRCQSRRPGSRLEYWNRTLGAVHVETPDAAVNVMANGWLLYQTLACRFWARTGFYQSGGAFGFRDQLQDVMALVHAEPALTREHLLRCCGSSVPRRRRAALVASARRSWRAHAFLRRLSVAAATLPAATSRASRRHRRAGRDAFPFSRAAPSSRRRKLTMTCPLTPKSRPRSTNIASAPSERALKFGEHGLPLMGCGDWNDGMNLVGEAGPRRKCLAGFLPLRRADAICRVGASAATTPPSPIVASPKPVKLQTKYRETCLGRPMVSPRLLRQRRAAWLQHQSRMPD